MLEQKGEFKVDAIFTQNGDALTMFAECYVSGPSFRNPKDSKAFLMTPTPKEVLNTNEGSGMLPSWRDVALWVCCQKVLGPIKLRRGCDQTLFIGNQIVLKWDGHCGGGASRHRGPYMKS